MRGANDPAFRIAARKIGEGRDPVVAGCGRDGLVWGEQGPGSLRASGGLGRSEPDSGMRGLGSLGISPVRHGFWIAAGCAATLLAAMGIRIRAMVLPCDPERLVGNALAGQAPMAAQDRMPTPRDGYGLGFAA